MIYVMMIRYDNFDTSFMGPQWAAGIFISMMLIKFQKLLHMIHSTQCFFLLFFINRFFKFLLFQVNIGDYIFEIMDLVSVIEEDVSTEWLYTNLRGIFLRHDEQLGLSHEDFILFYVLSVLHPDLPKFIRDKFKEKLARNRILDLSADILAESEDFLKSRAIAANAEAKEVCEVRFNVHS